MSEENVRLRECPFCGCEAAIESMPVKYHIFCVNCQANASDEYEDAVIGKWNTRAADQERDEIIEALKAGLACAAYCTMNTTYHERIMKQALAKIEKP